MLVIPGPRTLLVITFLPVNAGTISNFSIWQDEFFDVCAVSPKVLRPKSNYIAVVNWVPPTHSPQPSRLSIGLCVALSKNIWWAWQAYTKNFFEISGSPVLVCIRWWLLHILSESTLSQLRYSYNFNIVVTTLTLPWSQLAHNAITLPINQFIMQIVQYTSLTFVCVKLSAKNFIFVNFNVKIGGTLVSNYKFSICKQAQLFSRNAVDRVWKLFKTLMFWVRNPVHSIKFQ